MQKQSGIIFLDRHGFLFYEKSLQKILTLPFQPNVVTNLDVLNSELLKAQIKQFITANKIKPTTLIIILSTEVLFEKILPEIDEEQKLDEVRRFLDNMPFENVSTITYKLEKGYQLIAMNRDFYDTIKEAFEKESFTIGAVLPVFSLGKDIDLSHGLSAEMGRIILKKFASIRPEQYAIHHDEKGETKENKFVILAKKNKRLAILLIVFMLLLLVLIGFTLINFLQPQGNNVQPVKTINQTTPVPSIAPTISVQETSSSPSATFMSVFSIQIFYRQGDLDKATELKKKLLALGFEHIEIGNPQSTTVANPLVVFSTSVPQEIRDELTAELESLYGDIVSRQNADTLFDVTITLAQ